MSSRTRCFFSSALLVYLVGGTVTLARADDIQTPVSARLLAQRPGDIVLGANAQAPVHIVSYAPIEAGDVSAKWRAVWPAVLLINGANVHVVLRPLPSPHVSFPASYAEDAYAAYGARGATGLFSFFALPMASSKDFDVDHGAAYFAWRASLPNDAARASVTRGDWRSQVFLNEVDASSYGFNTPSTWVNGTRMYGSELAALTRLVEAELTAKRASPAREDFAAAQTAKALQRYEASRIHQMNVDAAATANRKIGVCGLTAASKAPHHLESRREFGHSAWLLRPDHGFGRISLGNSLAELKALGFPMWAGVDHWWYMGVNARDDLAPIHVLIERDQVRAIRIYWQALERPIVTHAHGYDVRTAMAAEPPGSIGWNLDSPPKWPTKDMITRKLQTCATSTARGEDCPLGRWSSRYEIAAAPGGGATP